MKNLFFLLTAIALLTSCDKDGQIFAGKDQLPTETQTGANTVGCLVNGKVFLPHQEGISSPVNCYYQFDKGEYYFSMSFSDDRKSSIETVSVFTAKIELKAGQTYPLNQGYNPERGGGGGI
ncbi:hypothetical protein MCETHM1_01963 [Flavobacteriaceae bacterium]